jgi:hypothetical protein
MIQSPFTPYLSAPLTHLLGDEPGHLSHTGDKHIDTMGCALHASWSATGVYITFRCFSLCYFHIHKHPHYLYSQQQLIFSAKDLVSFQAITPHQRYYRTTSQPHGLSNASCHRSHLQHPNQPHPGNLFRRTNPIMNTPPISVQTRTSFLQAIQDTEIKVKGAL